MRGACAQLRADERLFNRRLKSARHEQPFLTPRQAP
jgi:hypothetical protein